MKRLKIALPQWEGGVNPNYVLGAHLMDLIVPAEQLPTVTIPVADVNDPEVLERQHGIDAYQTLQGQLTAVQGVLATKQPDKVLMVGGNCAVSMSPFDYLSGRYGRDLGIVWLDAHPDISTTEESHHLHEMVVSSLLGKGAPGFNAHPPLQTTRSSWRG